jgi:DNA helicase HerA-like ATPase
MSIEKPRSQEKDANIYCVYGMRGTGKSTVGVSIVKRANMPTVIIDTSGSWSEDLGIVEVHSLKQVAAKIRAKWHQNFKIIYNPPEGYEVLALHQLSRLMEKAQANYKLGKMRRQVLLVVEEAHEFYPSEGMKQAEQGFKRVLNKGRHWGINVIALTQRPNEIRPTIRGQADITYCLKLKDEASIKAIVAIAGRKYKDDFENLKRFEYLKISDDGVEACKVRKPRK